MQQSPGLTPPSLSWQSSSSPSLLRTRPLYYPITADRPAAAARADATPRDAARVIGRQMMPPPPPPPRPAAPCRPVAAIGEFEIRANSINEKSDKVEDRSATNEGRIDTYFYSNVGVERESASSLATCRATLIIHRCCEIKTRSYLPGRSQIVYTLRNRNHNKILIPKTSNLNERHFLIRVLYKHCY